MRRIFSTMILGTLPIFGVTLEHYQLYKDIHIMKMGGANVGLGGSGTSMFYNPAGLSKLNKNDGVEFRLINLTLSTNDNVMNIAKDGLELKDIEDEEEKNLEVIKLAEDYIGKNNHFEVSNLTYLAKNINSFTFSIGLLSNVNLDFKTHRGFGSEGFFDMQGLVVGGGAFGLSYEYSTQLAFGVGLKVLNYLSIDDSFTVGKLISYKDDMKNLVDDASKDGSDTVYDLGVLYKFDSDVQLGFSALNIGGVGEKSHITYIPETYNLGLGYVEKFDQLSYLKSVRIGLDYTDLTDNYPESDFMKKIKTGFEANFIENDYVTFKGGLGLYQGYYTAGLDLQLTILHFSFTTYGEELGAYSGQNEDRRYLVNVGIGW
jgi:hypothetical protein